MSSTRDILIRILTKGDAAGAEKISGSLDQLAERADRVGKRLTLGVTAPLTALGAVAVKFAADAAESADKLEAVFGPATDSINAKIAELRDTIPATTAQLQDLFSGIQDLLVPLGMAPAEAAEMSESIVTLAGDLASFNNIPVEEALRRIRSGLVGQYEPLLEFGVALNATTVKAKAFEQGIGDGTRELTAAERAQVAYQLILEGTTAAHGNAADTADSAANQFKFLQSESIELASIVGEQLLPAITPLVSGLKDAARAGQDLDPVLVQMGVGLGAVAAAAGPALVATAAIIKYRVALQAGAAAVGPWIPIAAAAAAAYGGIAAAAEEAAEANQQFRDSLGLGDSSFVDAILGANSEEELDRRIGQAQVKLDGLMGAIEDQQKQIAEPRGFWESGILHERTKKGLEAELVAMQAQAAALRQAIDLGRERGDSIVENNQSTEAQVESVEELTELQQFLNSLTEEEKNLREETLADAELEIAILDAKIAKNEELVKKLEDQKKAQIIADRLEKGGATEEEAARIAEEIVQKTQAARKAQDELNRSKKDGIDLTRQSAQAEAEAEAQRQLKSGVRADDSFRNLQGEQETRYFRGGKQIDESEAFAEAPTGAGASSPRPESTTTTPNAAPPDPSSTPRAPDLAPVTAALQSVDLDTSALETAIAQMAQRLQTQIDNLAGQVRELGN